MVRFACLLYLSLLLVAACIYDTLFLAKSRMVLRLKPDTKFSYSLVSYYSYFL